MEPVEHHKRFEYCTTRLQYRQGRELKAVKVYSVATESKHLMVFGVPKVNLHANIKNKLQGFGKLLSCICVTSEMAKKMDLEAFTDVFAVHFERVEQARRAKRQLDAKQFFGGILHISYAPERETPQELREKFVQRRKEIGHRIQRNLAEQPLKPKQTKQNEVVDI
ncbi:RNA-binding protein 48 [Drosophila sulfurigaster albostrigata]|uniref:RNA-binding protein 48 n=1 Tax=Drosophila sulfurigaster albostrigata TaxID=89887 RepID=UPI002D21C88A|nr:RNA-binding protein 48 [Drosophila sulfurigaster albostrigata]XP_062133974.1 RNA-binding protein 48 [Drosophila sulfurigaster albostrigata]